MSNINYLKARYTELVIPTISEYTLQFFLSFARECSGRILNPMCANGALLVPIFKAGFDIEGYDKCEHKLKYFRSKFKKGEIKPRVWIDDIVDSDVGDNQYDLILFHDNYFNLIGSNDQLVLHNFYKQLVAGGTLVFEVVTISHDSWLVGSWQGEVRVINNDSYLVLNTLQMPDMGMYSSALYEYKLYDMGQVVSSASEIVRMKKYEVNALKKQLESVGFNVTLHKPYVRGEKVTDGEMVIFECRK